MSKLKLLIEKMSKSSPEAVNTLNYKSKELLDYLYVETEIEKKYLEILNTNKNSKCLIFLSGSSGDGKSAIINKHYKKYKDYYSFHVDATHSFSPSQTAIEALTESFSDYNSQDKSLVVGINIGIMLNFIDKPINGLENIQFAIKTFLETKQNNKNIFFINFEDYSKFNFEENEINSDFIEKLLNKITKQSEKNPFYNAYTEDKQNNNLSILHQNYALLLNTTIQKSIVNLLIIIYLKYDQFLAARSILDFIYTLLKGPKLLVNKLFEDNDNDIIKNISKEDPIIKRNFQIDKFILERKSDKVDLELNSFIDDFNSTYTLPILDKKSAITLIRTFYLFRSINISNDYHLNFEDSFSSNYVFEFIKLLSMHSSYEESYKKDIKEFYKNVTMAIYTYVNKNNPELNKKNYITLSTTSEFVTASYVEIGPNWKEIKNSKIESFQSFPLYLKINNKDLTIDVSLNMSIMFDLINNGYRPNKHDRNTIVIFEELIESIIEIAKTSDKLLINSKNKNFSFREKEDEIEVNDEI